MRPSLQAVPPLPRERRRGIPAKQVRGVESPATVLLVPIRLGDGCAWWSHDQILLGGLRVNSAKDVTGEVRCLIGYLPCPVPRSWGEREFVVVFEYEGERPDTNFRLRLWYGCGDPSELHVGATDPIVGQSGGKQRMHFHLRQHYLQRNELFRATLEVARTSPGPVLIYGVWLEVGVD